MAYKTNKLLDEMGSDNGKCPTGSLKAETNFMKLKIVKIILKNNFDRMIN